MGWPNLYARPRPAKDLESYIGPKSRVSEILNRKRSLSMNQVIKLHRGLGIPYECLLGE
jgi:HTH-type transcriptional regulator/antitoxin HigA